MRTLTPYDGYAHCYYLAGFSGPIKGPVGSKSDHPTLSAIRLWQEFEGALARRDRAELLALVGCIEAWKKRLVAAANDGSGIDEKPTKAVRSSRLLTATEIAEQTGLSERFFYEHADKPFAVRLSTRRLRFDLPKFLDWRAQRGGVL